jgi:hypothetical protein
MTAAAGLDPLFDQIARLTDSELMVLRSAWAEGDETARAAAWRSVKRILRERHREAMLDDARARLSAWVNNYLAATAVEYGNFLINPGSGMDAATVRREALPPLLDAVAATLAADELSDADQATLLEPLHSIERG